jgi:hypothetical protein
MPPFQTENGSPGDFPWSIYRLLIVQTEVCRLSVCWRRNKQKVSVCKKTKRIFLSMPFCMCMSMVHMFIVYGACLCLWGMPTVCTWCMSMSMVHVHVHDACPWPWCMPMSMVHVHVHSACPWCMPMSMVHAHVHGACPCPWCMPMSTVHAQPMVRVL